MGKYDHITNIKASSYFSDYYQNGTWHTRTQVTPESFIKILTSEREE